MNDRRGHEFALLGGDRTLSCRPDTEPLYV